MIVALCMMVLAYTPVQVLQTEQTLARGRSWSQDFILAPGDSLKVNVACLRQVGSCCGPLGPLGDVFLRKGDNVGRATVSEWRGGVITSAYQQYRPELTYYSAGGGAYTVVIENHSGHRTNLYSVSATRIPTQKKYAKFDASFKADTAYETTWVDEPVYRTYRDTVIEHREWVDTLYDEKPAAIKQGSTTLYRGILGSNTSTINFCVPENSTGTVGFALFTDMDRLRQIQEEARGKFKQLATGAEFIPKYGAAIGIAMGLLSGIANSGDGAFSYAVMNEDNLAKHDAGQPSRCFDQGESMSDALFTCTMQPGCIYYVRLKNSSFLDKSVVGYQIATTVREPRYEPQSEDVPLVEERQEQVGTKRVPKVGEIVTPHLPWNKKR